MTSPMNIKFTCAAGEDLFANASIINQITKHFGTSILSSIQNGNAGMNLTIFVDSATGVKFNSDDEFQCCILDKVYSSSGIIYPKHLYVQNAVSGTLSIQVQ
jgi:hypothetical protein